MAALATQRRPTVFVGIGGAIVALVAIGVLAISTNHTHSESTAARTVSATQPAARQTPATAPPAAHVAVAPQSLSDSAASIVQATEDRTRQFVKTGEDGWLAYIYATPRDNVMIRWVHVPHRLDVPYEARNVQEVARSGNTMTASYDEVINGQPGDHLKTIFVFNGTNWLVQ